MNPFDQIAELYERFPQPRTFDEDIAAHISTGYVVSTPEFFIMGRAINRDASAEDIGNPWHPFPREHQNCWLVYAYAGYSQNFLTFLPYSLSWVAFQRRGKPLKFYDSHTLFRRIRAAG